MAIFDASHAPTTTQIFPLPEQLRFPVSQHAMEQQRVKILTQVDRLRHDPSADKDNLRNLHADYNRIVNYIYDADRGVSCDILDIFPPEVWSQIVKEALPISGYAPALLLLTLVSNRWRDALVSDPTLWAHIEIRGSTHDSSATIETFKLLSKKTPILLSLYAPSAHNFTVLKSILDDLSPRLREIIVRLDSDQLYLGTEYLLQLFNLLLIFPDSISTVLRIHLENSQGMPLYRRDTEILLANVPSLRQLRELHGWSFGWRQAWIMKHGTELLERIESFDPSEDVLTSRANLPELRSLDITRQNSLLIAQENIRQEGLPHLPKLTQLLYKNGYRSAVITLLGSVAPQLLKLELRIPMNKCDLISPCLEAAIRLETLHLHVGEWDKGIDKGIDDYIDTRQHYLDPSTRIPRLRQLILDVSFSDLAEINIATERRGLPSQIVRRLIDTFRILYKDVEHLDLKFDVSNLDKILPLALEYISELPNVRTLRIKSFVKSSWDGVASSLVLPALEELSTSSAKLLRHLRTPSVHLLKFAWESYCEGNELLNGINASNLWITVDPSDPYIRFPRDSFPSLVELTISDENPNGLPNYCGWELPMFPFLSTITILTQMETNYATELCFELLYHPENCPSLSELRFPNSPPDWDILFIMLEKRNFMASKYISRIRRITLPFLSHHLRAPLAALLRGLFTTRPSNEDLLMGGSFECFLDDKFPGCYTCISNFLGPCNSIALERVDGFDNGDYDYHLIRAGMSWKTAPPSIDSQVAQWITTRESLCRAFLSNLKLWGAKYSRSAICDRRWVDQTWDSTVEITEHEQIDYSGDLCV